MAMNDYRHFPCMVYHLLLAVHKWSLLSTGHHAADADLQASSHHLKAVMRKKCGSSMFSECIRDGLLSYNLDSLVKCGF